jgi:hypothetical protein
VILVPRAVRVYFAIQPVSLRKSFDGLANEIRHALGHDPLGGHVFVFLNRRKNQVKLIVWTRGGFTIVHKRLLCAAPHKSRYAEPGVMRSRATKGRVLGAERVGGGVPLCITTNWSWKAAEQRCDEGIGCLESTAAKRRRHQGLECFELLGWIHPEVDLGGADVGVAEPE